MIQTNPERDLRRKPSRRRVLCAAAALCCAIQATLAAQELTAREVLLRANENTLKQQGYHFTGTMTQKMPMMNMDMTIEMDGIYKAPQSGKIAMTLMGMQMEMFFKDNRMAILNPATGQWQESPMGMQNQVMTPSDQIKQMEKIMDKAELGKKEKIGDRACQLIKCIPKYDALRDLLREQQQQTPLPMDYQFENVEYNFWVGESDKLIYRISIQMAFSMNPSAAGGEEEQGEDLAGEEEDPFGLEGKDGNAEEEEETEKMTVEASFRFEITDYNKDLNYEIPEEALSVLEGRASSPEEDAPFDDEESD